MSDETPPARKSRMQSQTERDLEGIEARKARDVESAFGVPIVSADGDAGDFTPVRGILETFADEFADNPRMQALVVALWRHSANQEQRFRDLGDEVGVAALRKEVAELNAAIIDLTGKDGKNGKVGRLRGDVDKILSRAWWLITVAVAGIGAAAVKLLIVGSTYGELKTRCDNNSARLGLIENVLFLRSVPAAPEKASP